MASARAALKPRKANHNRMYRFYAPMYNWVFAPSFADGHEKMVEALAANAGDSVLEVGVGTGASLHHYSEGVKVVAIDASAQMLAKARKRIDAGEISAEVKLQEMDAHHLEFEDDSFDHSVIAHAIAVVGDPQRVIQEMIRVTRPGGRLVVVNHHRNRLNILARAWEPFRYRLGLGRNVELHRMLAAHDLEVISDVRVNRIHTRMITTRVPEHP
ncbi:MAG TPA: methyltransferase domain-containing protein [Candidatus Poseidoniales archaeon]|nr:methyltransferase domain-containing protein [Candidatus Poseidoniales archaeon]